MLPDLDTFISLEKIILGSRKKKKKRGLVDFGI